MNLDVMDNACPTDVTSMYHANFPRDMGCMYVQSSNSDGDEEMAVEEPGSQCIADGVLNLLHRPEEVESGTATPDTNPRVLVTELSMPTSREEHLPASRNWYPMGNETDRSSVASNHGSGSMSIVEDGEEVLQPCHGRNMATLEKWENLLKSRPKDPMAFYWREMIAWCRARVGRPCIEDDEAAGAKRMATVASELDESVDMLDRLVKRCRCNDDASSFQAGEHC
uniref:Uncharacterized protein n=1 Tax=Hanusia phi TaxID=3032 RepID=A0A7S0EX55_9CRYP|mmetsp:Transcript_33550/g.75359  ORF Transcript_33550/g.75359 Transcript_33550/m.75359 type:complete len:225 (+) Transcript_33550:219-893(+)|eukprot:768638-Hanusia_phi.AAC.2